MDIERRRRRPLSDHFLEEPLATEQRDERFGTREHHRAATRPHGGSVPNEVEDISQSLLRPEQQTSTVERTSVPARLWP